MINILVALKLFCKNWAKQVVRLFCDNSAMVQVLQSGRTKDPYLAACARNVWLLAAKHDIQITYVHIAGKKNRAADLLSRWTSSFKDIQELLKLLSAAISVDENFIVPVRFKL